MKILASILLLLGSLLVAHAESTPTNFLIITADDMNWDSVGCYGCPLPDTTPTINQLAADGILFEQAHVASTACYPSRSAISTGRRGHRSGGEGFFYLRFPDIPTVQQLLHDKGYRVGILGKVKHSTPYEDTPWDTAIEMGRETDAFAEETGKFLDQAIEGEQPFYLIVNSHDPHRPYYKVDKETDGSSDEPSRIFQPDEIPIHPTIPDHPDVRYEQACYFSSVRRFDDVVKATIAELEQRGLEKNTMIILLSDHGMAVPSAKSNLYTQSTRTPFIVRWDGHIQPGQVDKKHIVSTMDILPTILEVAGIENPGGMDGKTLTGLFEGKKESGRDLIFTQYYMKIGKPNYQMRAAQTTEYLYLFNPWHNGLPVYSTSSLGGSIFKTMFQLGKEIPEWKERSDYLLTRVPEEFFDLRNDPHCLNNLIEDPAYAEKIDEFRGRLRRHLNRSEDPMLEPFDVYRKTQSVEKMTETYLTMWEKHDLPGLPASNPVKMDKWQVSE